MRTAAELGISDAESYMMIVHGVSRLSGHQVVSLDGAWKACTGLGPEFMSRDDEGRLRWLLRELKYERMWVREVGRTKMMHMFAREEWPMRDFYANLHRHITCYVES